LILAEAETEPVRSAFRPGYTQVLNLLVRRTLAQALEELQRSLAAFEAQWRSPHGFEPIGRRPPAARRRHRTPQVPHGAVAEILAETHEPISQTFLRHAAILQSLGYLDADAGLTPDGRWAARLRHPRVLVLAEIVRRDGIPNSAPRLAAMAAALGTERAPRGGGEGARLGGLAALVRRLSRLEVEAGLEPDRFVEEFEQAWDRRRRRPVGSPAERRAVAAEGWARGAEWGALTRELDVEEGDLQRIVLQAAEVLMQLEGLPQPIVRTIAHETRLLLLRPPVL